MQKGEKHCCISSSKLNPKTLVPMQKGAMRSIFDDIKLEKVANSLRFYRIFTEAIQSKPSNHKLILKVCSLKQQPSKSPSFKFLEFL